MVLFLRILRTGWTSFKRHEGKLYGSVAEKEVMEALRTQLGVKAERVEMPEHIKTVGEHTVSVILPGHITANLTVNVEQE